MSRIAAACIEQNHDDKGIIWPAQIAPYQVHLIGLNLEEEATRQQAEAVYARLQKERIEVLFDDRPSRAGEKFSDADLIGIPVRLTISKRTQDKVEIKLRKEQKSEVVTVEDAIRRIKELVSAPG